jgi:GH25 family lysozyme M1 (1,4-beta-N-acetylmuramidase)
MMKKYNIPASTFVWYDVERDYDRSTYETVVPTFINKLKSLGYSNVGVYGSVSALDTTNGNLNSSIIKSYPIWVAQYYKKLQYSGEYKGWQYSSSATVDGINGRVDISVFK